MKGETMLRGTELSANQTVLEFNMARCDLDYLWRQGLPSFCVDDFTLRNFMAGKRFKVFLSESYLDFNDKDEPVKKVLRQLIDIDLSKVTETT